MSKINTLYWPPRIICILAILFVSMFALETFQPKLTIWEEIAAFFMLLIPSFLLIAILIIAWKWELIGGIILIGIGMSPFVFNHSYNMNNSIWMSLGIILIITIPFALVGVLFIMSYSQKKKESFIKLKNKLECSFE